MPSSRDNAPLLGRTPSSRAEMDAAFDDDADDSGDFNSAAPPPPSSSPPGYESATTVAHNDDDVYFDAGDAMAAEAPRSRTTQPPPASLLSAPQTPVRSSLAHDPLGVSDGEQEDTPAASSRRHAPRSSTPAGGYDFEEASYFGAPRSGRSRSASPFPEALGSSPQASTSRVGLDSLGSPDITTYSTAGPTSAAATQNAQGFARARLLLGRFGRYVGMRVPGANYSTVATSDVDGAPSTGVTRSRRVMGGGINQDGVFANLNAKPEGRRRRQANGGGNPDDRGEDDDLEDDVLPPTYEVAAADTAPGYWETTIAPGGLGWTPGGGHVGDVEDLILEGLPIGNFFGFAWNLLVSMCFQFVGFLLTYLLHTTHAARCGSRAGLGVTLIQYGFYLRTRGMQLDEGGVGNGGGGSGGSGGHGGGDAGTGGVEPMTAVTWWGATLVYPPPPPDPTPAFARAIAATVSAVAPPAPTGTDMATSLANDADSIAVGAGSGSSGNGNGGNDMSNSSDWLAYMLMVLGWFILLSSLLSYWRVHRWGRALVAASRREQEAQRAAENGGQAPDELAEASGAPVGFINRLREAMRVNAGLATAQGGRATGTGEDWIIFPAAANGRRGTAGAAPTSGSVTGASPSSATIWGAPPRRGTLAYAVDGDDEDDDARGARRLTGDETHLSPEERRLIQDMRGVGL
ncbi:hypothetical protein BDZ90DRAFT_229749, partial [Jaminaea rosea]